MKIIFIVLCVLGLYGKSCGAIIFPEERSPYLKVETDYANSHITKVGDLEKLDYTPPAVVDRTTLDGKVIVGYQGWFGADGDGCPVNKWYHWSRTVAPNLIGGIKNSGYGVTFNLFPDVNEYSKLYRTNCGNLGNGEPSMLFSSYNYESVDLHFQWMREYGIEAVALQRFLTTSKSNDAERMNTVMGHVIRASEKYGRTFFIAYDPTGYRDSDFTTQFKKDLTEIKPIITASPAYLKQDGKPVIQIVEFGNITAFRRPLSEAQEIINWLKEQQWFVILGVPSYWRTGTRDAIPEFSEAKIFETVDMLIPWSVGRFINDEGAYNYYQNTVVKNDLAYLHPKSVKYAPVLFAGFDFSMWIQDSTKKFNEIPRHAGAFFNTQAKEALNIGVNTAFIGMFDEYDEATAIAKIATDSFETPENATFITTSTDGFFVGNDYYLRLVGQFQKLLRDGKNGEDMQIMFNALKKSIGPVLLRTGFEKDMDMMPDTSSTDIFKLNTFFLKRFDPLIDTNKTIDKPKEVNTNGGSMKLEFTGTSTVSNSDMIVKHVDFEIGPNTKMQYFKYSESMAASKVYIDLIATDGTRLSNSKAITYTGKKIDNCPSVPGKWGETCINIGKFMGNKTIKQIVIVAPKAEINKAFTMYFDDLTITDGALKLNSDKAIK